MTPRLLCASLTLLALAAPVYAQEPRAKPVMIAPAPTTAAPAPAAAPAPTAPVQVKTEVAPVAPLSKTTAPVTSFAPVQKGGPAATAATSVPACWGEGVGAVDKIRGDTSALLAALGGDASDRASAAGAMQAHVREYLLRGFESWAHAYLVVLPYLMLYYFPHSMLHGCDTMPEGPFCVALAAEYSGIYAEIERRSARTKEQHDVVNQKAAALAASGSTTAIKQAAARLGTDLAAFGAARAACIAGLTKLRVPVPAKPKAPTWNGGTIAVRDFHLTTAKGALVAANEAMGLIAADLIAFGTSAKGATVRLRDAVAVFADTKQLPSPKTLPASPEKPAETPPNPIAVATPDFEYAWASGDFEIKVGKKTFTVENAYVEIEPGSVKFDGPDLPVGACSHSIRNGSRLDGQTLVVKGKLQCGAVYSGTSELRIGGGKVEGTVETERFGHKYRLNLALKRGELEGSETWTGASTDWQGVPGLDLEYRVDGPTLKLAVRGTTLTATFDAKKVELRTKSRKPDGTPWSSASMELPPRTLSVAADPRVALPLPTLPKPADVFAGARNECIDKANRTNPPGRPRELAIGACNGSFPAPPAIPSPPTSISVEVKVVIK